LLVARSPPWGGLQVVLDEREQAGSQFSIRRQTDSIAVPAEWRRDRRDDPNLAGGILETPSHGRLGLAPPGKLHQRKGRLQAIEDLAAGHDLLHRPLMAAVERHELDEPDRVPR